MARLIDADALPVRKAHCVDEAGWGADFCVVDKSDIDNAPTIEAEPVKHGRWIEKPFLLGTSNFCSMCDSFYGMPHGKFNYCPNCGAKMQGGNRR